MTSWCVVIKSTVTVYITNIIHSWIVVSYVVVYSPLPKLEEGFAPVVLKVHGYSTDSEIQLHLSECKAVRCNGDKINAVGEVNLIRSAP